MIISKIFFHSFVNQSFFYISNKQSTLFFKLQ